MHKLIGLSGPAASVIAFYLELVICCYGFQLGFAFAKIEKSPNTTENISFSKLVKFMILADFHFKSHTKSKKDIAKECV